MTDIVPVPNWGGVRQLETNEYATGGLNGNMNEQAKSLASQNMYSRLYAGLPFDPAFTAQVGGFPIGGKAALENGDIVRSTVANNTNDPNVNMDGWVNSGNPIFVKTVSEMVSKNLKDGDVVKTIGYNNVLDDGGALYLISNTSTNYSIQLSNGNHAIFSDDFDILKFGIVDNENLDQTTNIERMVAYADSRVHEIDFHNFSIMSPKTKTNVKTNNVNKDVQGMPFKFVHNLKNLKIANDKTVQLQKRTVNILFCPDADVATEQVFKLTNVTFDPYVADHVLYTGVDFYDACCHGFMAHPSENSTVPAWGSAPTNYIFEFENINFISPAYSYNLTTSAIFSRNVKALNLRGEFLALYLNYHSLNIDCGRVVGYFRDDLLESGRTVVKNLIHFEAELTNKPNVTFNDGVFEKLECYTYSTGLPRTAFKMHVLGSGHKFKDYTFKDTVGLVEFYAVQTNIEMNKLLLQDSSQEFLLGPLNYNTVELRNFENIIGAMSATAYPLTSTKVKNLTGFNVTLKKGLTAPASAVSTVDNLNFDGVSIGQLETGILRHSTTKVGNINLKNVTFLSTNTEKRLIECVYDRLEVDVVHDTVSGDSSNVVYCRNTDTLANTYIRGYKTNSAQLEFTYIILGKTNVNIEYSSFLNKPVFSLDGGVLTSAYVTPQLRTWAATFDPPSIQANSSIETTVYTQGLSVGTPIAVSFSRYNAGIEVYGVISSGNTTTIRFKNITGTAIDLPSGTISIKYIQTTSKTKKYNLGELKKFLTHFLHKN